MRDSSNPPKSRRRTIQSHSNGSDALQRMDNASNTLVFPQLFGPTSILINPRPSNRRFFNPRKPLMVTSSSEYSGILIAPVEESAAQGFILLHSRGILIRSSVDPLLFSWAPTP